MKINRVWIIPTFYTLRISGSSVGVFVVGEHIDYCGYAVLPMAVEQDIVIAAAKTDTGLVRLANTDLQYS